MIQWESDMEEKNIFLTITMLFYNIKKRVVRRCLSGIQRWQLYAN